MISVQGEGWSATIYGDLAPNDEWSDAYCVTSGETENLALFAAEYALDLLAKGRKAYIRVEPEVVSELDYDTKKKRHRGLVRFGFKLEAGEWHYPPQPDRVPSIGEA